MKNMRRVCRILLWVGEQDGPVSTDQVAEGVGITHDQAQRGLRSLLVKQKVTRTEKGRESWWQDNPEFEPAKRPGRVQKAASPVARSAYRFEPVAMQNAFKFADAKINLLERLKHKCVDGDRDLIEGMIADYKAISKRRTICNE